MEQRPPGLAVTPADTQSQGDFCHIRLANKHASLVDTSLSCKAAYIHQCYNKNKSACLNRFCYDSCLAQGTFSALVAPSGASLGHDRAA